MNAKETINQHKNGQTGRGYKRKRTLGQKGNKKTIWIKEWTKKNSNEINEFFKEIYYNTRNPASFSGVENLHSFIKKNTKEDITRGEIKDWLWKQEVYTHHPVRRKFKRPMVIAFTEKYQWDTDTANMVKYKEFNQ